MKILVAGDFCPQNRVAERFEQMEYDSVLGEVRELISGADYSIVNFECPIACGKEKPIVKEGPNLKCTEKGMEAVKWAGFDCVTLANNHFLDYGAEGVENTIKACKKNGMDAVGGGMNLQEASKILYKNIEGKTLAIINCCEHEFSIATENTAGSNPLNPIQQYYAISDAKQNADYVLVIMHGGHELWQLPSPRMQETYRFFVDSGADAVINHHQHCFSGYEIYKNKPIFYGLGNFCFDKPEYFEGLWEYGYIVCLNFEDNVSFEIFPYKQCKETPKITPLIDSTKFNSEIKDLNEIIADKCRLRKKTISYYQRSIKKTGLAFEPYQNRFLRLLYLKGLLPITLSKYRKIRLSNMIMCEAHRDKTIYFLNKQVYD